MRSFRDCSKRSLCAKLCVSIEETMEKILPKHRFQLKARIFEAGSKTVQEFAAAADTDHSRVSRVIGGYEYPSD